MKFASEALQQHLCVDYLYRRFLVLGNDWLAEELWPRLELVGWQDLALKFLELHVEAGGRHSDFLDRLDLEDAAQADFFVTSLVSGELHGDADGEARLPLALACALVHPQLGLAEPIGQVEEWAPACREWVYRILGRWDTAEALEALAQSATLPATWRGRWAEPRRDRTWEVANGPAEARFHAVLRLVADLAFLLQDDPREPIGDPELDLRLAAWLDAQLAAGGPEILWSSVEDPTFRCPLPVATNGVNALDRLVGTGRKTAAALARHLPARVLLLQGEAATQADPFVTAQPCVLIGFAAAAQEERMRWAVAFYERLLLCELVAAGPRFDFLHSFRAGYLFRQQRPAPVDLDSPMVYLRDRAWQSRVASLPPQRARRRAQARANSLMLAAIRLPRNQLLLDQVAVLPFSPELRASLGGFLERIPHSSPSLETFEFLLAMAGRGGLFRGAPWWHSLAIRDRLVPPRPSKDHRAERFRRAEPIAGRSRRHGRPGLPRRHLGPDSRRSVARVARPPENALVAEIRKLAHPRRLAGQRNDPRHFLGSDAKPDRAGPRRRIAFAAAAAGTPAGEEISRTPSGKAGV